jgi:uncharacterized membrane protein YuzA (DUF378 family)
MSKYRLIFTSIFILFVGLFALATPALAVNPVDQVCKTKTLNGGKPAVCEASNGNRSTIFGSNGVFTKIAQVLVYFAGAISVIMLTIGGFRYTTSQGNPSDLESAKNTIIYALVGLIVAIFAQGIVSFVLSKF